MLRHLVLALATLFVVATVLCPTEASAQAETRAEHPGDVLTSEDGMPVIAKNQARPDSRLKPIVHCDPEGPACAENPDDGGGDGYQIGACNCKRQCNNSTTFCYLTGRADEGCKRPQNATTCENCTPTDLCGS